jgi:hypothetical protein
VQAIAAAPAHQLEAGQGVDDPEVRKTVADQVRHVAGAVLPHDNQAGQASASGRPASERRTGGP